MPHWAWLEYMKPQSPPPMTDFLQQCYTHSNKATPSKNAIPCEPMGLFSLQLPVCLTWSLLAFIPLPSHCPCCLWSHPLLGIKLPTFGQVLNLYLQPGLISSQSTFTATHAPAFSLRGPVQIPQAFLSVSHLLPVWSHLKTHTCILLQR